MRVALITPEFPSEENFDGGLSNYLLRVSKSLIQLGHTPIVFVVSHCDETIDYQHIKVIRVKNHYKWWFWLLNAITLFQFRKALIWVSKSYNLKKAILHFHAKNKIDIIQYASSQALGLFRPKYIPSVIRISSLQKMIDNAYGRKSDLHNLQKQWLQEYTLKKANALFGPSKMVGAIVQDLAKKEVEIIETPFIIPYKTYDESMLNEVRATHDIQHFFLFFGTLGLLKGVKDIAEIIFEVLEENPTYHFIFIGKDTPINNQSTMELLKEKGKNHQHRIHCLGRLPHLQLYPFVQKANIIVLPSRVDNFPNVCIEAMAFKKTVIGTYGTSFEQLIVNEKNGFLCEHSLPDSLLSTIRKVAKLTTEENEKIGEKAAQRIDQLKPEKVVKALVQYYQKIINTFSKK